MLFWRRRKSSHFSWNQFPMCFDICQIIRTSQNPWIRQINVNNTIFISTNLKTKINTQLWFLFPILWFYAWASRGVFGVEEELEGWTCLINRPSCFKHWQFGLFLLSSNLTIKTDKIDWRVSTSWIDLTLETKNSLSFPVLKIEKIKIKYFKKYRNRKSQ